MKQLYVVRVQGEVYVMADTEGEARREAGWVLDDEKEALIQEADPVVDEYKRAPLAFKYTTDDVLESFPWNADKEDRRTVGDHLKALGLER